MNPIGVIIVDYQSDPLLARALKSLSTITAPSFNVIIVENDPKGPRVNVPGNLDVKFLSSPRNLGFGRAVNLAQRHLQVSYFFLLNPDVFLLPETLSILYTFMENHADVGLAAPKLLNRDGKLQFSSRAFYNFHSILFRRTILGKLFSNHSSLGQHLMEDWDHNSIREIDWALGACMMVRAQAVGAEIFDPRFFLYFEDVDLCLRLKKTGWKVVYHPEAVAIHDHRQQSRNFFFSRANCAHFASWLKFILKYRSISGG